MKNCKKGSQMQVEKWLKRKRKKEKICHPLMNFLMNALIFKNQFENAV